VLGKFLFPEPYRDLKNARKNLRREGGKKGSAEKNGNRKRGDPAELRARKKTIGIMGKKEKIFPGPAL